jgi:ATP-binding cassette, subfamily B, bacterial
LATKLQDFATRLSYLPRTVRLIWTAAQGWTLAWGILLVFQGLLPAATVYLTRLLVDSLVLAMGARGSWEGVQPTLFLALLLAGVMVMTELLQSASRLIRSAQAELVRDHLSTLIHEKSVAVDLAFYESPIYHDRLERARNDLNNRPLALLENGGSLLQNTVTLLAMATLLIPYGVWLPFVLLAGTLPAFYIVLRFHRRYHQWWEETTPDRRRAQYYDTLLTDSTVAAELRSFDLGPYFRSTYMALRQKLRAERIKLTRDQSIGLVGAGLAGVLIFASTMAWMGWRALHGLASLGDLVLFYQAFSRGQILVRTVLENVGQIFANILFLGNLFEFLGLESRVVDPPKPVPAPSALQQAIHFQRVTFRYPGSERMALQDFNLTIPAGQVVAIVGANGAGKSTLIKLLCRFYDPQAGCITLDGIDVRELSLGELRRMITVLFQWLVPYQTTAAQNIALGDLSSEPSSVELEVAARAAGVHEIITRLPEGYNTLLGKWFANGTELSWGEWQRLALARAFLRRAQIIVLDEPTSALDSWSETEWFDRFRVLANGRTAIIITHRFTIARRADMIHVMDEGRIVESGPHDDLLALGGVYSRAWLAQVQDRPGVDRSRTDLATFAGASKLNHRRAES